MDGDFASLFESDRCRLTGALSALGGDPDAATEAVDEESARALELWSAVPSHPEPAGWLFATARNVLRRRALRERLVVMSAVDDSLTAVPTGGTWLVVANLSRRQHEVVVLRHVAGLTERAIGEAFGISWGTVSSTLRNAYRTLAIELGDELPSSRGGQS